MLPKLLLRSVLLSILATTSGCSAAASPRLASHEASVSLGTSDKLFCSGVAVKPHVVMTATHCLPPGMKEIWINGVKQPLVILASDVTDHSLIRIKQRMKPVRFGAAPEPGDFVFIWGMPSGAPFMFRQGYYSGLVNSNGEVVSVYDLNIWGGDSGSGIFDARGKLVGTTISMLGRHVSNGTVLYTWKMAVSRPYSFTDKQWKEANG